MTMFATKAKKIKPSGIPRYEPIPVKKPPYLEEIIRKQKAFEDRMRRQQENLRKVQQKMAEDAAKMSQRHYAPTDPPKAITRASVIVEAVCKAISAAFDWDVPIVPADLATKERGAKQVLGRAMCAMLLRDMTTLSWPWIVRSYGKPGHAQAIESAARIRAGIEADLSVSEWIPTRTSGCQQSGYVKLRSLVAEARRLATS